MIFAKYKEFRIGSEREPGCLVYVQASRRMGGFNEIAPARAEADGIMARKAPQLGKNLLGLSIVRQWSEHFEASAASPGSDSALGADPHPATALHDHLFVFATVVNSFRDSRSPHFERRVTKTKNTDSLAIFTRFATLSTLSTSVAPEHGNLNHLFRSGSHPTLDEAEAPTLDATGLRYALRLIGHGMPNRTSVRPMLAEFGEVVGCQLRLTYAQFETLRAALNAGDEWAAAVTLQCVWRAWRARGTWHRVVIQAKTCIAQKATVVRDTPWWLDSPCKGAWAGDEGVNDYSLVAAPDEYDLDAVFGAKSDDRESAPRLPLDLPHPAFTVG